MRLIVREALVTFKRAPLLSTLSVTTIAFALFVIGLFGLVAVNLQRALARVEERVEVVAYVFPGTQIETITAALADIDAFPEVASATHVTEDEALIRARTELAEFNVQRDLERNPLPASIEVKLRPGFRDTRHVGEVAARLAGFDFVEDVRYGRDWVEKLDRLRQIAFAVGLAVGAAFAVVAVIIIGTTIRMAVLQRAREITIMRLVGATDAFIRSPFLLQGALKGLLGGGIAVGLTFVSQQLVGRWLEFETVFFSAQQGALIVAFGMLIGFLGSLFSVGRHLRKV